MRSNFRDRHLFLAVGALLLSGCATSAPELPPNVDRTTHDARIAAGRRAIKVASPAWLELSVVERDTIQAKFTVDVLEVESYGIIIDNQAADESTHGTTAGANLGGAVANAAYIDNALRGGSYSATTQLAAGILGAAIGSTMDAKPNPQFHFRYTVKLGDGDIQYFDEYKRAPFRHSVGVCVSVPDIALIGQQVCSQTAENLRAKYLKSAPLPAEKQ